MKLSKIKSITPIGKQDVYNMEVQDHHNFSVNGGLIVHNCYDSLGYGLIAYHMDKSKTPPADKSPLQKHKEQLAKRRQMASRMGKRLM